MSGFEYYCCWADIFNANALQDFLDEKGKQGWETTHIIPEKNPDSYKSLIIMRRILNNTEKE